MNNTSSRVISFYQYTPVFAFIRDIGNTDHDRLDFHAEQGDYFATLATLLGSVEESIVENYKYKLNADLILLRQIRQDLIYLNKNYDLKPKTKSPYKLN